MFRKNGLFCITAIVLCSALSAGCSDAIDDAGQENEATENSVAEKTGGTGSDSELSVKGQNEVPGLNPAGQKNQIVDYPVPASAGISNSPIPSTRGNGVVNSLRVWRDRDLRYATCAELLEISLASKSVKLLKENGVAITVPIDRLSEHDRNFLVHFVAAQTGEFGKQLNPTLAEQSR